MNIREFEDSSFRTLEREESRLDALEERAADIIAKRFPDGYQPIDIAEAVESIPYEVLAEYFNRGPERFGQAMTDTVNEYWQAWAENKADDEMEQERSDAMGEFVERFYRRAA